MFVAIALTVVGVVWFIMAQRRPERPYTVLPASAAGAVEDTKPDDAAAVMNDRDDAADAEDADHGDRRLGDRRRGRSNSKTVDGGKR